MIKHIYSFYNKKINAFGIPVFHTEDTTDFIEIVTRDFKASDVTAQGKLIEHIVYELGTYDDATSKFNLIDPNPILDLGSLVEKKEA